MTRFRKAARGAAIGAAGGALVGVAVEVVHDALPGGLPFTAAADVWPPVLALTGLLGALVVVAAGGVTRPWS